LPPAAIDVPLIDQAEALVLQLEDLLLRMADRDRSNLGHLLDILGQAAGLREDLVAEELERMHGYIGPGNRVMGQIDREQAREAREREAAVAAIAALPLLVVERDEVDTTIQAMVFVRNGRAILAVNVLLIDRHTAERWARRHLGAGELFAVWMDDDPA
jgi:hypothetical protein